MDCIWMWWKCRIFIFRKSCSWDILTKMAIWGTQQYLVKASWTKIAYLLKVNPHVIFCHCSISFLTTQRHPNSLWHQFLHQLEQYLNTKFLNKQICYTLLAVMIHHISMINAFWLILNWYLIKRIWITLTCREECGQRVWKACLSS